MFEFGGGLNQLLLECAMSERRAMRDDVRTSVRCEFERLAEGERRAANGRQAVRGWVGGVVRSARALTWALFQRTPSDTPA